MKRVCLLLAILVAATIVVGCTTAHDQFRQMTYRRDTDADVLGVQDDFDTGVLLSERPTHLSTWYNQ
jgi:hypothetical protein